MAAESPELLDHMLQDTNSNYQPGITNHQISNLAYFSPLCSGLTPVLRLKPKYHPETSPLSFGTHSAQQSYDQPKPAYTPPPYIPPAPVGPVLLKTRPYEVKSVQPLPITVSETYTSFDCRSKPYPGRHYADEEAGCEVIELNLHIERLKLFLLFRFTTFAMEMEGRKLSSVDMAQSSTSISEPVTSRIVFTVLLVRDMLQNLMVTMNPILTMNLPHINLFDTTNMHHTLNLLHT